MSAMAREEGTGIYKVVEVTDVCDQGIESALNRCVGRDTASSQSTSSPSREPAADDGVLFFMRTEASAGE